MKKVLSIWIVFLIVTAMCAVCAGTASAAVSYSTVIKIGSDSYYADVGNSFSLTVSVRSNAALCAGQIELPIDFAYLSGDTEQNLNGNIASVMPTVGGSGLVQRFDAASAAGLKGYVFNFASDNTYDFSASQVFFTVKLKVLKAGTIYLSPTLCEFLDEDLNDVTASAVCTAEVSLPRTKTYSVKTPLVTGICSTAQGLRINWGAVSGAGKYRVFRLTDGKWRAIANISATYYIDKNVLSGQKYTYTVRAMDSSGKTWLSDYGASGWSGIYYAEPAVSGFSSSEAGLKLTWKAVDGASAYRVYRKNGAKWATVGVTAGTSFVDHDVVPNNSYTYTLRVVDADGAIVSSYNANGFTGAFLGAPVLISAANVCEGVQIRWQLINGAEKYRVFRKNVDTGWFRIGDTTGNVWTDRAVDSDTVYQYTVRCISADAKRYTSPFDPDGLSVRYIAAPAVTAIDNTAEGTVLAWGAVDGAEKYRVFRKMNGTGWKKLADTAELSYTDANVTAGTAYIYTVRCISADGSAYRSGNNGAGWSNTYLSAPVISSVGNYDGFVQVKWEKMPGAGYYRVFRRSGGSGWKSLGNTKGLYWNDKTAVSGTDYTYTVRCISSDGKKFTSPYDTAGKSIRYIAAPVMVWAQKRTGGVQVRWNLSAGAEKYRVFRKEGSGGWKKLGDTVNAYWNDRTVVSGKTYTYTVRCINADASAYTSAYDKTGKTIAYTL